MSSSLWTHRVVGAVVAVLTVLHSTSRSSTAQCDISMLSFSDGNSGDKFGTVVAVAGDVAVIGAPRKAVSGLNAGAAYVFRFDGKVWVPEQRLLASDRRSRRAFGGAVAVMGNIAVIGAPSDSPGANIVGSTYVFRYDGARWNEEQKLIAADGDPADLFGASVAFDGDTLLVGAPNEGNSGIRNYDGPGAAYVFRHDGAKWAQQQKLVTSLRDPNAIFGNAVTIAGDMILVGNSLDNELGRYAGSAYVFNYDGSTWLMRQKLLAMDGARDDRFGTTIDITGATVVIGAPWYSDPSRYTGSAYVFRHDGSSWSEEQKLLAADRVGGQYFGQSVAISTGLIVVGARGDGTSGTRAGAAYAFRFDGIGWTQEQKLLAPDGDEDDFFGYSVALSGGKILIGANQDDDRGFWTGSAYVFKRAQSAWIPEQKLLASMEDDVRFGSSVDVFDGMAVVGAPGDDEGGAAVGAAYMFRRNVTGWQRIARLIASDAGETDEFGSAVAINADDLLVGAPRHAHPAIRTGAAYAFRAEGNAWGSEQELLAIDGGADDLFGVSVAVAGEWAVIGASGDDDLGERSGSAYVFRHDGSNWSLVQKLNAIGGGPGDAFGQAVAISRIDPPGIVIGAPGDSERGEAAGSAYVFSFDGTRWVQQRKLLADDAAPDDRFGGSVDIYGNLALIGARGSDAAGVDSGSAYVFRLEGAGWIQRQQIESVDAAPGDEFGAAVSLNRWTFGTGAVVGAPRDDDNGPDSGAAYVFVLDGSGWRQHLKFVPDGGGERDEFGVSVAAVLDEVIAGAHQHDGLGLGSGAAYVYAFTCPCEPCDMNCDGEINVFDIDWFVSLLFGSPPCSPCAGDVNGDGRIDAFDIAPFLECLFP